MFKNLTGSISSFIGSITPVESSSTDKTETGICNYVTILYNY